MSWGLVICNVCRREVHQDGERNIPDGPNQWRHCEDKTPRCDGATSRYLAAGERPTGAYCERDGKVRES